MNINSLCGRCQVLDGAGIGETPEGQKRAVVGLGVGESSPFRLTTAGVGPSNHLVCEDDWRLGAIHKLESIWKLVAVRGLLHCHPATARVLVFDPREVRQLKRNGGFTVVSKQRVRFDVRFPFGAHEILAS